MSVLVLVGLVGLLLPAVVFFFLPRLSPRTYFFGLTVPLDFRASAAGRAIENRFRAIVAAAFAIALVAIGLLPQYLMAAILFLPVAALAGFFYGRRLVAPFAAASARQRVSDPHPAPDLSPVAPQRLPAWTLLALPPFAILAGVGFYLQAHWSRIPERFPVHWGANGQPNRWVQRTVHGVYGPLGFGAVLLLFVIGIGLATWYGSRPSPLRVAILKVLVTVTYLLGIVFGMVGLLPLRVMPPFAILVPTLVFLPVIMIYATRISSDPDMAADPTPDSRWHLSSIYYNPSDPALFVPKRLGMGYTFNFGNPMSWVVLAALLALVPVAIFMLK